tara:strand:- start:55 stop:612 length:558 start_codon:yes stop_codon:yes gene_type:complete
MLKFKEVEKELEKFKNFVVEKAKSNLVKKKKVTSGNLLNSIDARIIQEADAFLVEFLMEDYGKFVDQGVKGKNASELPRGAKWYGKNKAPKSPYQFGSMKSRGLRKAINKWTIQKNLKGVRDAKGRFVPRKTMQFLISRSIYLSGIKSTLFFTSPYNEALKKFSQKFTEAFVLDVENNFLYGQNK